MIAEVYEYRFSPSILVASRRAEQLLSSSSHHTTYSLVVDVNTGGWDQRIVIFSLVTASPIATITDHHADIYSLDVHPHHPFTLVSCSRDTTLRLWHLLDTFPHVAV